MARRAFGLAYRIVGDGAGAEDVVQEAFLTLWMQSDRLDPRRGRVDSLLLTVVHHRAVDMVRARRGQAARAFALEPDAIDAGAETLLDAVADAVTVDAVRASLARLPEEQRAAIEMAYFEGLTHTEIAEALRVPLGTVKSRLRLGLDKIRVELGVERRSDVR